MPEVRTQIAKRPRHTQSAVTTGKRHFVEADGRSAWARRYRDLVQLHAQDLGGIDLLSEAQISLLKRIASLTTEIEAMEGRMSEAKAVDLDVYVRSVGLLRRLLETIGLERRQKDVTPDIRSFMEMKAREKARNVA